MGYGQPDQTDLQMMGLALGQARDSLESGGVPGKLGFTGVGRRPIEPPSAEGTGTGVVWRLVR